MEQEVDKTLNSLEGLQRAAPTPFLFTRVKASLENDEKSRWTLALAFISRPSVAFATILITLFVNAIIFFEFKSESAQASGEGEQLFANEYNLANNNIYDSTIEPE